MTQSHYILIAGDIYDDDHVVPARQIYDALVDRGLWLIWRETPYQREYQEGDRVLFYLARSGKCNIVGAAELVDGPEPADQEEMQAGDKLGLIGYDRKLRLRKVQRFPEGVQIRPLIPELTFIKNKKWWGHSFRQSAIRIPKEDFDRIIARAR